jgi:hypothetical protein
MKIARASVLIRMTMERKGDDELLHQNQTTETILRERQKTSMAMQSDIDKVAEGPSSPGTVIKLCENDLGRPSHGWFRANQHQFHLPRSLNARQGSVFLENI